MGRTFCKGELTDRNLLVEGRKLDTKKTLTHRAGSLKAAFSKPRASSGLKYVIEPVDLPWTYISEWSKQPRKQQLLTENTLE